MATTTSYDWVELVDPQLNHSFYANVITGECSWQTPSAGLTKLANAEEDWWELWDEKNRLPYYYHSKTNTTVWTPPSQGQVLCLTKIQASTFARHMSLPISPPPPSSPSPFNSLDPGAGPLDPSTKRHSRSLDLASYQGRIQPSLQRSASESGKKSTLPIMNDDDIPKDKPHHIVTPSSMFNFSLSSKLPAPLRRPSIRPQADSSRLTNFAKSRASIESAFSSLTRPYKFGAGGMMNRNSVAVSAPATNPETVTAVSPLKKLPTVQHPPYIGPLAQTGDSKKSLPTSLQQDINQFAIDGFAKKYFATHKRGLFRRRVPMNQMLQWTKDSIRQPLIMLNKDLYKDALRCFKLIQIIMGERPRPRGSNEIEEMQTILSCGITKGQMRDEIYVQLCRQLNGNPKGESIKKGWEILCVISVTFPPSKNLESYLFNFIQQHHHLQANQVNVFSHHVTNKLKRICLRGAKGKVLTAAEIERAKEAPFKPSVFGESLDLIMRLQSQDALKIPRIVPFLADTVHQLNGQHSEGIFRVPGDADAVTELRIRIENGRYDATDITDPNVPASLLKYWLRDLSEPLIGTEYYDECIACSDQPDQAIAIVNKLPELNRRIVLYMISFLQEFTAPEVIKETLMNVSNLAMVFAPNFLRCPSESLTAVFENSKYEQAFLRTLLFELKADKLACAQINEPTFGTRK
ncbi:uncharacterized protein BYT42DRAFT_562625 [Radiomyces spectabilis]|uniref:uncharacterized protein n=1 Tax=Radiomyces spectabilis TaxID=64574 RepID=UPI00221E8937|nr:uncharacterized protein BYT42DRAFT_562625 [Radiomyces spectabilis]KAI8384467.1 hypothetical protein BYT42DRAFT_562625 [Radiomyces spectabilis]